MLGVVAVYARTQVLFLARSNGIDAFELPFACCLSILLDQTFLLQVYNVSNGSNKPEKASRSGKNINKRKGIALRGDQSHKK